MISTFKSDNILPTSTTYQSRLQLFQPTRRPKAIDRIIETAWGKIRIKGRIGQAHADIFEAMLSACDKHKIIDDGRIRLLIDPYRISQISNQNSWSSFKKNLDDLKQALIEIREPQRLKCIGHLIDHIGTARQRNGSVITKSNPFGGVRELWIIELGKVGTTLINYDLRIFYDTQKIANLTHGISQAIARHILTHKTQPNGGWLLDRLILVTGAAARSLRDRRRELRQDALLLVKLGIFISNGHVEYKRGGLEYKRGEANFCGA